MSVLKTRVGYDVLAHAIRGLLSDVEAADETLGSLLALGLENFSIPGVIASLRSTDPLSSTTYFTKFMTVLPLTRICLLLLGDRPSPVVASQVLLLIGISLCCSSSFRRKLSLLAAGAYSRR
jgi:hypothetical protein